MDILSKTLSRFLSNIGRSLEKVPQNTITLAIFRLVILNIISAGGGKFTREEANRAQKMSNNTQNRVLQKNSKKEKNSSPESKGKSANTVYR